MVRRLLLTALVALCLPLVTHSATWEGSYTVGSADNTETPAEAVAFVNSTGLYTSPTELDRFKALADAAGTDQYDTDLASLLGSSHAGGVDTDSEWDTQHTISAEEYEGDNSTCRPSSVAWNAGNVENYDLTEIASSLYSLALAGSIENDESYFTEAHNHLLELTETSFDLTFDPDLSIQNPGSDQCGLDMATAIPWIAETAMILEQESFAAWSYADRFQLATWMAEEVFPLVHWTTQRKNNWGPAGLSGALAIAWYVDGPITSIVRFDGASITPASYYGTGIGNDINRWISNSTPNELDSATSSLSCAFNGQVFGIQPTGTVPDDVRRSTDFNDCDEPDLEFAGCLSGGGPYTSGCGGFGGAVFYQQKSTQLLTRTFEALRRIDGNGDRGYELAYREHGGANEVLYDMILASTTLTTGSDGDFQDIWTTDTTQGYRWMAGQYYAINKPNVGACITDLLDDGSVFIEGGNDVPYSRITHADGVAYDSTPSDCTEDVGSFVEIAGTPLAAYEADLPYTYLASNSGEDQTPLVNYSTWDGYDVTCECADDSCVADSAGSSCTPASGKIAFPNSWGCSPVTTADSDAQGELNCQWGSLDDEEYLYVPNGTYTLASGSGGIPAALNMEGHDTNGILGESKAGTVFILGDGSFYDNANTTAADSMGFMQGPNTGPAFGSSETWTGGVSRGDTDLVVGDTATFPVGSWVHLQADASGTQAGLIVQYYAKVESVVSAGVGGTIRIDRRLPTTFGSSNRDITQWTPTASQFFLESFTVRPAAGAHVRPGQVLIRFANCVNCHVKDVAMEDGWNYPFQFDAAVRTRIEDNDIDGLYDKPFNGYAMWIAEGADNLILNNLAYNYAQVYECGAYSMQNVFAWNTAVNPEPNALWSTSGTSHVDHSGDHAYVISPDGFLHCSNGLSDAQGSNGTSSCRGTRAADPRVSMFLHNAACTQTTIIRERWESGIATDNGASQGPGNNQLIFGVTAIDPDGDASPLVGTHNGSFGYVTTGSPRSGYRHDWIWMNNSLARFGESNFGFDMWMDGAVVTHNVFRETPGCYYDNEGSNENATARADCSLGAEQDGGQVNGTITWSDNDVDHGSSARTSTDVMPTAPGFGSWIVDYMTAKGGSGTFPWNGADMGPQGGAASNCSPSYMRYYGACPGTGDPNP